MYRVRAYVKEQDWKASVVPEPSITHRFAGGSRQAALRSAMPGVGNFSDYDDNAGRRAVGGHMTKEQAFAAAQAFLADL